MGYKVYPVIPIAPHCDDYRVFINGNEVSLNTARVSAVPFNRRWPGHQRQLDQTEEIQFLSLASDEPLSFEIIPSTTFESVKIRPRSLGIVPRVENGIIKFTLDKPAYFTVEPYGRNHALHIFADPMPSYSVDIHDPSVIYFGAGEHEVGMLEMHSNQTVLIDEGAVVYGCIHATDADHIRILGRGILDNSHNKAQILFSANEENNESAVNNAVRVHTVQLEYCNNVQIEGITVRDSLVYNIRPIACKNLNISNVKIIGCWRYNSDGIDMHNCIDVNIDNCFIRTFDDSICIKGFDCYYEGDVEESVRNAMYRNGKSYDVFKNVNIRNCVIWNDWGKCLEIGAETRAKEICNVTFESCSIIHVCGSPLDCMNVDYADVHDIAYKNITVEYDDIIPAPLIQKSDAHRYENFDSDYNPALICVEVCFHHEYSAGGQKRGKNRNILFENIRLYGKHMPRLRFMGYKNEYGISDITAKELYLNDTLLTKSDVAIEKNQFCKNIQIIGKTSKENSYERI